MQWSELHVYETQKYEAFVGIEPMTSQKLVRCTASNYCAAARLVVSYNQGKKIGTNSHLRCFTMHATETRYMQMRTLHFWVPINPPHNVNTVLGESVADKMHYKIIDNKSSLASHT